MKLEAGADMLTSYLDYSDAGSLGASALMHQLVSLVYIKPSDSRLGNFMNISGQRKKRYLKGHRVAGTHLHPRKKKSQHNSIPDQRVWKL